MQGHHYQYNAARGNSGIQQHTKPNKYVHVCYIHQSSGVLTRLTEDFVPVGIWSLLEFDVAILCACMPAMRTLFIRLVTKPTDTYAYGSNRYNYKVSGASVSQTANSSRARQSQHISSKALPSTVTTVEGVRLEQEFIRLEEVETESGSLKQDTHNSYEDPRTRSAAHLVRKESS
jgi:hypothetical protein